MSDRKMNSNEQGFIKRFADARSGMESCGCMWRKDKPEQMETSYGTFYAMGWADPEDPLWIIVCALHSRYGFHREMQGFDDGISK